MINFDDREWPTCPHCRYVHEDGGDLLHEEDIEEAINCDRCGKDFLCVMSEGTFSSRAADEEGL
jgi:hypothetical protein